MISITVCIAAFCLLYYYCTRTYNYWRNKNVAGPKPIPFFGNLKDSTLRRKQVGVVYKEIYDQFPNENVIGLYRMTRPALLVRDLDIVKQILIKDFDVFPERGIDFNKDTLGDNLFHCDSTVWKTVRNLLTPLFTTRKLRNMTGIIDKYAEQLVSHLEITTNGEIEHEICNIFTKYTMASIMATSFSLDINFFSENQELIEKIGRNSIKSTYVAEMNMMFPNLLNKIKICMFSKSVNKFCNDIVQTVSKQRNGVSSNQNDLIDTLFVTKKDNQDSSNLTDTIKAAQVLAFFVPGFANNAITLCYTLFHLAKREDVQNKLIEEVDAVLAKYDGKFTYDALLDMTYLDNVYSEILRINTVKSVIQRSAKKNYEISGTDIVIEKGTVVLVSPYAIHRDERLYPEPEKFDPERFSPENTANRHPFAYIPFGAGPRACIGKRLGKLQFAAAIVRIFSKFRVEPSDKTTVIEDYDPMNTFLYTKGGVYVRIIPRTNKITVSGRIE